MPVTKKATRKAPSLGGALNKAKSAEPPKPPARSAKTGSGWFSEGYDASEEVVRRSEQAAASSKGPRRFWLKPGTDDSPVLFVTGKPFVIREHEYKIGDSWKNRQHFTCLQGTGATCPFCEGGNKSYNVGMYTWADLTEYDFQGKTYKNQIRIAPAKAAALKILNKIAKKRGDDLTGCVFNVSRTGDKTSSIGDMFEFVERINLNDPKALKKYGFTETPKPINYREVLQPLSREEALEWLKGSSQAQASDEEVPY